MINCHFTMKAKKKKFDCVEMKNEIQRKLLKEMKGLSPDEQRRMMEHRIQSDPIRGPFLRKVKKQKRKSTEAGIKE